MMVTLELDDNPTPPPENDSSVPHAEDCIPISVVEVTKGGISGISVKEETKTEHHDIFLFLATQPPFRVSTTVDAPREKIYEYLSRKTNIVELVICIAIFILGSVIPKLMESSWSWQLPIPYQVTDSGQVLLDLDFSHDVVPQTIPGDLGTILCIIVPLVVLFVFGFFLGPKHDVHAAFCVFLVACGLTTLLTNTIKLYTGQFRPNFYQECGFNKDTLECEDDPSQVRHAQRSFPSGHSSQAFASMTVLTLYFLGKVGIQRGLGRQNGYKSIADYHKKKLLSMLAASPMALALYIAASRVHDSYHHPADIVAGSVLGGACALFVHGLWYPSVYSSVAGYPLQTLYIMSTEREFSFDATRAQENV